MTSTRSFGEGSTGTQACGMRTRRCSQRRPVPVLGDTGSRRSESRTSTRSTEGTPRRAGTKPALLDHPRAARRRRSFGHTAADQHALLEPRPRSLSHRRRASSLPPRRRARARSVVGADVLGLCSRDVPIPSIRGWMSSTIRQCTARATHRNRRTRPGPGAPLPAGVSKARLGLTTCSVQSDNAAEAVRTQRIRPRPTGIDAPCKHGTRSPRRESDDTFQRFGAFRRSQRGDR